MRLVDFDSDKPSGGGAGLACTVTAVRHLEPTPQPTTVTIWNLTAEQRDNLYTATYLARNQSFATQRQIQAGRIIVRAGRDNLVPIANDVIVNCETPPVNPTRADQSTTIYAQDGRLLWSSLVAETVTPFDALALAGPLPPGTGVAPVQPTYTGSGDAVEMDVQAIMQALGRIPSVRGDAIVWLPDTETLGLPDLSLDRVAIPPLEPLGPDGTRNVTALFDPSMLVGRAMVLKGQRYRAQTVTYTLGTHNVTEWTCGMLLAQIGVVTV